MVTIMNYYNKYSKNVIFSGIEFRCELWESIWNQENLWILSDWKYV